MPIIGQDARTSNRALFVTKRHAFSEMGSLKLVITLPREVVYHWGAHRSFSGVTNQVVIPIYGMSVIVTSRPRVA